MNMESERRTRRKREKKANQICHKNMPAWSSHFCLNFHHFYSLLLPPFPPPAHFSSLPCHPLLPKQFPNLITVPPAVLDTASPSLLQLDYLRAFHGLRRERTVLQIPITNMTSAAAASCAIWRDAGQSQFPACSSA